MSNKKDKDRLQGYMLNKMGLGPIKDGEGREGFILLMRFQTSPLLNKVLSRDINMSVLLGAKPTEIAKGLRLLADKIIADLPDKPHLVMVPKEKKIRT